MPIAAKILKVVRYDWPKYFSKLPDQLSINAAGLGTLFNTWNFDFFEKFVLLL